MKRTIQIEIGGGIDVVEGAPHPSESYLIQFSDENVGFSAQTACLCSLKESVEAWLNGESDDEVMALMSNHSHE